MQLRHLAVVALEEGHQVACQVVLVLGGQAADDAAVDGDVLRIARLPGADEDVARVHVGVEEAVAEHLGEENLHAAFGQQLHVGVLRAQGGDVGHRHAVDALHDQHLGPAVIPVDLRHVDQRRAFEVALELAGVGRFAQQVELVVDDLLVVADHFHRVQATRLAGHAFGDTCEQEQPGQVLGDDRPQPRADHLDHHVFAAVQARGVHLGDRGRGQRLLLEAGEHLGNGRAQLFLDQCHGPGRLERRHLVLQQRQFVGDVLGQQDAAGGENLPELDEHRAQVLQRQAQPRTAREVAAPARQPAPGQGVAGSGQPPGQRQGVQQIVETIADDDQQDAQQAAQGGEQLHEVRFPRLRRSTRASRRSRAIFIWSSSAKRASASRLPTRLRASSVR